MRYLPLLLTVTGHAAFSYKKKKSIMQEGLILHQTMVGHEETSMHHEEHSDAPRVLPASSKRRRPGQFWQRLRQKVREGAFSPAWLVSPWNSLAVGYGSALLFPALAVLLTWFLLRIFPMFAL